MFLFILQLPENGILSFLKDTFGELLSVEYTSVEGVSVGSLFLCKVISKSETLKGFFVDCGTVNGFLPFKEAQPETKVGDIKLLQLKREKVESKSPLFTEKVKLPEWLKFEHFKNIKKSGLILHWENYFSQITNRDIQIFTNSKAVFYKLTELGFKVNFLHTEDLLKKLRYSNAIKEIFQKRSNFENGYLLVEPLKTANFVDVNGNGYPLEVNLSAAPEIVRQINIKRLGGVVIVDFLNLKTRPERRKLKEKLKELLIEQKTPCKVLGFTKAQHFELSCLKKGEPLTEVLTEKCDLGKFKFWDILVLEILEKLKTYKGEDIKLKMHPIRAKVLEYLKQIYIGRIDPIWDCFMNPNRFEILIS